VPEPLPPQGERRSLKLASTAFPYRVIPVGFVVDCLGTGVLRGQFISDAGIVPSLEDERRRERVVHELGKVFGGLGFWNKCFSLQCRLELMFQSGVGCCR
jgi:poly(A) polymerase